MNVFLCVILFCNDAVDASVLAKSLLKMTI